MKIFKNLLQIFILLLLVASIPACGGGGGGSSGNTIAGRIVNESAGVLAGGSYSVQGSGVIGSIGGDGSFAAITSALSGRLILVNSASGFRFRRVPFNTAGQGSLDLGNVVLPNDALSNGWAAYRGGNLSGAELNFNSHINASGRDIADAQNGLGWTLARTGREEEAFPHLLAAVGSGFDPEVRTALAMAYLGRTTKGVYSIPQAISNLDLAITCDGLYLSKPLHDDVSEDDLIALRAMLNLLDGRIAAATADRNAVLGKSEPRFNKASEDLLGVVDFFLMY